MALLLEMRGINDNCIIRFGSYLNLASIITLPGLLGLLRGVSPIVMEMRGGQHFEQLWKDSIPWNYFVNSIQKAFFSNGGFSTIVVFSQYLFLEYRASNKDEIQRCS